MDLDRLHTTKGDGKGTGRTYDMLVAAAHMADFGIKHVDLVFKNAGNAITAARQLVTIANDLFYNDVAQVNQYAVNIENTKYFFWTRTICKLTDGSVVFVDHGVTDDENIGQRVAQ